MINQSLKQLYETHQGKISDKWSIYLAEYDRIFATYRNQPIRMLEIGIQNGGSLEIWAKYFPNAEKFIGCDINPDCAKLIYDDSRISVVVGDANIDNTEVAIRALSPYFDLIIDDGSHTSSDIIKSFAKYWPHIVDGGIFVAEDLHCSYWENFNGGLFEPFSSIAFFKRLSDIISYEHWGLDKTRAELLMGFFKRYDFNIEESILAHIHSVEFINSICIIRKKKPIENTLGFRFIAGSDEHVVPGHKSLHLTAPSSKEQIDQRLNKWANRPMPADEELIIRLNELEEIQLQFAVLKEQLNERTADAKHKEFELKHKDSEIWLKNNHIVHIDALVVLQRQQLDLLHHSISMRVTAPIRYALRQVKRIHRILALVASAPRLKNSLPQSFWRMVKLFLREGWPGVKRGLRAVEESLKPVPLALKEPEIRRKDYLDWIHQFETLTDADRVILNAAHASFSTKPLISVLMPTYNPKVDWLVEAIESVRNQIYPHWELCIADDASSNADVRSILESYVERDSRIKIVMRSENGHISAASNSALELVTGKWVALLDHDDLLSEHALFWVAHKINAQPNTRLIYSDEDKIDENGIRFEPHFKSDWNLDLFYSYNMFSHLGVYESALLRQVGGFRSGFEGAQDYDLALRCIEQVKPEQIAHIPRVLYHWRVHPESTAMAANAKPYAMVAGERALNEHFTRSSVKGRVRLIGHGFEAKYDLPATPPLVSIIIPTRNGLNLLKQCIDSILTKTIYSLYELIIIDNGSDDVATLNYLQTLTANPQTKKVVHIIRDDSPFNYSRLNNQAVSKAKGEVIALLNNDIEVISPEWLTEMVSHAIRPGVGAVGAKLWYPDNTLQHGGVLLGVGGVAAHSHPHIRRDYLGYFSRAALVQNYSAVTAACLVVRKHVYQQVGGLNELDLAVAFNDVDFCIRVREAGYRNVWTPFAELYHHESATRGYEDTIEKQIRFAGEVQYMQRRWGDLLSKDPAYSPNLTLESADFTLAWPPRVERLPTTSQSNV